MSQVFKLVGPNGYERVLTEDEFGFAMKRLAEDYCQNKQAIRHWAAMTRARAEELRFIGMGPAADRLDKLADELTQE